MLIDDIEESMLLGKKYLNAKNAKAYLDEITYQEPIILKQISLYEKVVSARKPLSKVGVVDSIGFQRIKKGFKNIKDDVSSMDSHALSKDVEELADEISRELNSLRIVWNNYRSEHMKANEALIVALQNVIADEAGMDELSELKRSIALIDIGDENAIKSVELFASRSKDIIKALEMGDAVEEFLIALSEGQEVNLEMVTPEIHEWLKKHNLLRKIQISM